jgi:hypothetical protein
MNGYRCSPTASSLVRLIDFRKRRLAVGALPTELLPTVPHIQFSIFNLAIPDIAVWAVLLSVFAVALWARLPRVFEPRD